MNLDELQRETERLLALLKDRQHGTMSWNLFLQERIQNITNLAAKAGIQATVAKID